MCGITGWVAFDRDLHAERATVDAMTGSMACRGPDADGVWVDTHAAVGHRRLAVIDLVGGRQPMAVDTPDGPVVLTYSGEAYNFAELRAELTARGHRLRTSSDTEVVLHGYLEWGSAVAERLSGMYAFAVWDGRTATLVMVRDRMGQKPLYYFPTPDGVLFGSEPKAILANPLAEPAVNLDGIREMFAFIKTPGHAVWAGMREVVPGTVVTVDANGSREHVYWRLESSEHADDRQATVAHVRALLDDAVRGQLVADVPLCTLLSGGLDSSALTALAARRLAADGERVRSFAVGLTGGFVPDELRSTPDAPYVHDVAAHSGTAHTDIALDGARLADPDVRAKLVRARDLPMGLGDMDVSLYLLFAAIREHSTVALSGESADEVFGGYRSFFDPDVRLCTTFPWLANTVADRDEGGFIMNRSLMASLDMQSYVQDSYHTALGELTHPGGESDAERRMRTICYLYLTRFMRILLDRKDRLSMAVGLEVRVPFCDHRLVEYVYNTPWSMKTYDDQEKSLLRGAIADELPRSVLDRRKSPYPSTQDPVYVRRLQGLGRDLLTAPSHGVFDLVDQDWLRRAAALPPEQVGTTVRHGLEQTLDISTWVDMYRPAIKTN